jgi:hypothetical protein
MLKISGLIHEVLLRAIKCTACCTASATKIMERWDMYSHECKRSHIGRMEQSKAMEYRSRKASPDVLKPRNSQKRTQDKFTHFVSLIYLGKANIRLIESVILCPSVISERLLSDGFW